MTTLGKHWKVKDTSNYGKYWIGKKRPDISSRVEEKSIAWKGENVCYRTKHIWIENKLGKPNFCEHCRNGKLKHRQYHWANISRKYKRNLNDWKRLCVKCHKAYDRTNHYAD